MNSKKHALTQDFWLNSAAFRIWTFSVERKQTLVKFIFDYTTTMYSSANIWTNSNICYIKIELLNNIDLSTRAGVLQHPQPPPPPQSHTQSPLPVVNIVSLRGECPPPSCPCARAWKRWGGLQLTSGSITSSNWSIWHKWKLFEP